MLLSKYFENVQEACDLTNKIPVCLTSKELKTLAEVLGPHIGLLKPDEAAEFLRFPEVRHVFLSNGFSVRQTAVIMYALSHGIPVVSSVHSDMSPARIRRLAHEMDTEERMYKTDGAVKLSEGYTIVSRKVKKYYMRRLN